mmetsp:Transcript_11599/g.34083  ORF Transcript_11599/g.34083 Transcript_11599/m.34083 type:complete len:216 (+) Transcript_11599:1393-2040(+)
MIFCWYCASSCCVCCVCRSSSCFSLSSYSTYGGARQGQAYVGVQYACGGDACGEVQVSSSEGGGRRVGGRGGRQCFVAGEGEEMTGVTGESHDLQRVPRLHQHVVLALRLFELGVEVVARLLELLAVGHVFEPQLILALHRQLLHLLLELRHRLRLLLEVGARDERLLRKRDRLAHELRAAAVLVAQVKDEEGGVLRHREDEGVVRRDAQPGDGR